MARSRSRRPSVDIWPGFVDVLSTLLLVIIFLLVVFVLAQFFLTQALSGQDKKLQEALQKVNELADLLSLEQEANADLRLNVAQLSASLQTSTADRDNLVLQLSALEDRALRAEQSLAKAQAALTDSEKTVEVNKDTIKAHLSEIESLKRDIAALRALREKLEGQIEVRDTRIGNLRDRTRELEAKLVGEEERTLLAQKKIEDREVRLAELQTLYLQTEDSLEKERNVSVSAKRQVALLNQQLAALRQQLARLEAALDVAESKDEQNQVVIADLGKRLNLALASKVEELSRYRSEFFGRLREVLAGQQGIRVVGDRFVFQSEVLFNSGSAEIEVGGQGQLAALASTLLEIAQRIPPELNWVLRIDGHTDDRPIQTPLFPSNWELSSARAISVVKFLIEHGVPADRLVAAGFGEFHPLDSRADEIALRRNRRIELKLTQR